MPRFDHDFVEDLIERLRTLPADARPRWGSLTAPGMVDHLCRTLRYALGRSGTVENQSSWLTRHIVKPLAVRGFIPIPRRVKAPPAFIEGTAPSGDVETLHALLEEYLAQVESGELDPPDHPVFGPMTVDEWAQIHAQHFEHHLSQFGL